MNACLSPGSPGQAIQVATDLIESVWKSPISEVIVNKKVSLILLLLGLLVLPVASAAADTQPLSLAIGLEEALNLGDPEAMTALFTDDAVFINGIGGEAITGRDAISEVLAGQTRPERSFEIVSLHMDDSHLTMMVDIADHGIAWGRQTLEVVVEDGLIRLLEPVAFRFLLR
jgi:hypothetical protein